MAVSAGSPWKNPSVESLGSPVRDEALSVEAFDSLLVASTGIEEWRTSSNQKRPHSSLGWRPDRPTLIATATDKPGPVTATMHGGCELWRVVLTGLSL